MVGMVAHLEFPHDELQIAEGYESVQILFVFSGQRPYAAVACQ